MEEKEQQEFLYEIGWSLLIREEVPPPKFLYGSLFESLVPYRSLCKLVDEFIHTEKKAATNRPRLISAKVLKTNHRTHSDALAALVGPRRRRIGCILEKARRSCMSVRETMYK